MSHAAVSVRRRRVTVGQAMMAVACGAIVVAAFRSPDNMLVIMLGFLIVAQVTARVWFAMFPTLGMFFLGLGRGGAVDPEVRKRVEDCLWHAQVFIDESRYRDALQPLEDAADLDPRDRDVVLALAACYRGTGQPRQAISVLERAEPSHTDDAEFRYELACACAMAADMPRALYELGEALALDPGLCDRIAGQAEFSGLRNEPRYQAMVAGTRAPAGPEM